MPRGRGSAPKVSSERYCGNKYLTCQPTLLIHFTSFDPLPLHLALLVRKANPVTMSSSGASEMVGYHVKILPCFDPALQRLLVRCHGTSRMWWLSSQPYSPCDPRSVDTADTQPDMICSTRRLKALYFLGSIPHNPPSCRTNARNLSPAKHVRPGAHTIRKIATLGYDDPCRPQGQWQ